MYVFLAKFMIRRIARERKNRKRSRRRRRRIRKSWTTSITIIMIIMSLDTKEFNLNETLNSYTLICTLIDLWNIKNASIKAEIKTILLYFMSIVHHIASRVIFAMNITNQCKLAAVAESKGPQLCTMNSATSEQWKLKEFIQLYCLVLFA